MGLCSLNFSRSVLKLIKDDGEEKIGKIILREKENENEFVIVIITSHLVAIGWNDDVDGRRRRRKKKEKKNKKKEEKRNSGRRQNV